MPIRFESLFNPNKYIDWIEFLGTLSANAFSSRLEYNGDKISMDIGCAFEWRMHRSLASDFFTIATRKHGNGNRSVPFTRSTFRPALQCCRYRIKAKPLRQHKRPSCLHVATACRISSLHWIQTNISTIDLHVHSAAHLNRTQECVQQNVVQSSFYLLWVLCVKIRFTSGHFPKMFMHSVFQLILFAGSSVHHLK